MQRPAERHLFTAGQPGRATCERLTCKCKQAFVIACNGWKTQREIWKVLHSVLPQNRIIGTTARPGPKPHFGFVGFLCHFYYVEVQDQIIAS